MNGYITAPAATISAHRLWTNLWMRLGQAEDNPIRPGGNRPVNGWGHPGMHSRGPEYRRPRTGPVDARIPAELRREQISPVSTDPMTTTFLFFADIPSTQQAVPAVKRAVSCHGPKAGGIA